MKHYVLRIVNGGIYIFLGLWMMGGTIGTIIRPEVRQADVGYGYRWSVYVTDTYLLQNGLGMILFFGALLLITKGVFMILHAIVDKKKHKIENNQVVEEQPQDDNLYL
jgi:hypothetical protein